MKHEWPIRRFGRWNRRKTSPASGWRTAQTQATRTCDSTLPQRSASAGLILLEITGKPREAEKAFGLSEGLLATLRKNDAEISFYRLKHAEALSRRGSARAALDSLDQAEADCRAAQALLEPVLQKSSNDTNAAGLLALTLTRRGRIAWARNDRDAAKKLWDDAIARCELAAKQPGGNPRAAKLLERIRAERTHGGPAIR